ncbi:DUF3892 domain-containing protein [Sporolactobacillus spathodeae]|uniref:DUF3892 domain-containing protein n=1 Tax=Sporolactobacillus spathodeae TaxID=1465502 RepID=A0ABS2Q7D9_9BACL|nr:DUF3892 domain-containing protein [Sporolactobacillus spathodeae]MBM7657215.1 hypothetical protein [Sporolactobacillus spathodeae]
MAYEIKAIHLDNSFSQSTESISKVRLSDGTVETKQQVVNYIDQNLEYYYTTSYNTRADVESVHPYNRTPYIRTKGNQTTKDNLLSLPQF